MYFNTIHLPLFFVSTSISTCLSESNWTSQSVISKFPFSILNRCIFCNSCLSRKLTFSIYISQMARYDRLVPIKQHSELAKCQPHGLISQLHFQLHYTIITFINNDGFTRWLIYGQIAIHLVFQHFARVNLAMPLPTNKAAKLVIPFIISNYKPNNYFFHKKSTFFHTH